MARSIMWICNNERSFMFAELPVCGKNTSNMNWYLCTSCHWEVLMEISKSLLRSNCISTFAIVPTLKSSWWISMAWASLFPCSCPPGLLIIYATDPQSFLDQLSSELGIAHLSRPWSNGWVALSFLFVRSFVRPAMVTSSPPPLLLAPDPQTHTFSESLW